VPCEGNERIELMSGRLSGLQTGGQAVPARWMLLAFRIVALGLLGEPPPGDSRARTRDVSPLAVTKRLQAEGRWKDIEPQRDEMMRLARKQDGLSKLDAQSWVYSELDRLYPPPVPSPGVLSGDEFDLAAPGHSSSRSRTVSPIESRCRCLEGVKSTERRKPRKSRGTVQSM